MNQYQKWPEENYPKKCPVHNCYVFHPTNSPNFIPTQKTFVVQKKPQIIQIKNLNNNPQYNSYTNYNQTDPNILLRQYQSPDGVLRGYNNNYSFYVSGSSKVKSNVTINNQINNYTTQTMGQYPMKINGNNPSYLILEKEPIYYNYNTNYNTNNYNQMPNKNVNIQQRVYQAPKIEKRTVKRIIDKEPITQKNSKLSQVQNNIKRNINTVKQKEMFKKINPNNNNYAKYNRYQISNKKNISPIIKVFPMSKDLTDVEYIQSKMITNLMGNIHIIIIKIIIIIITKWQIIKENTLQEPNYQNKEVIIIMNKKRILSRKAFYKN